MQDFDRIAVEGEKMGPMKLADKWGFLKPSGGKELRDAEGEWIVSLFLDGT